MFSSSPNSQSSSSPTPSLHTYSPLPSQAASPPASPAASSPATSSLGSIPSPSSYQDIKLRDCADCSTQDYLRLPTGELQLTLKLCRLYQGTLLKTPTKTRTSAQPASSPLHASSQHVSSPTGLSSASRSSSSPPPSRRRRLDAEVDADSTPTIYSRGSVPGEALEVYTTTLIKFLGRKDHKLSLAKFLKVEKIPESSFYRKRRIAELMILDPSRFDTLVKNLTRTQKSDKINQQVLSDRCAEILRSDSYTRKRRMAIAAGELL